ncbi:hypothetical protein K438DRAFT_1756652 [Mycena galopus ATCC 62051]|nr:hypothetical protein K438DRAFT_1756652 [Mycena galopus ATCC 62051]
MNFYTALFAILSVAVAVNAAAVESTSVLTPLLGTLAASERSWLLATIMIEQQHDLSVSASARRKSTLRSGNWVRPRIQYICPIFAIYFFPGSNTGHRDSLYGTKHLRVTILFSLTKVQPYHRPHLLLNAPQFYFELDMKRETKTRSQGCQLS